MKFLTAMCILTSIMLVLITGAMAGTQEKGDQNTTVNNSPLIFSFSKASPSDPDMVNMTLQKSDKYQKNESLEAYYNGMSEDVDMTLPRLTFLGIPMECHMCH